MACQECGTPFCPAEPLPPSAPLSRRAGVIAGLAGLIVLGLVLVDGLLLALALALFTLFYLPLYLPFLVSFAFKTPPWRGLRWSLRAASVAAVLIRAIGMSGHPDFGDDVPGNLKGAALNFAWTWGSGAACTFLALIVGVVFYAFQPRRA